MRKFDYIGLVTLAVFFALSMIVRGAFSMVVGFKLRGLRGAEETAPVSQTATFV